MRISLKVGITTPNFRTIMHVGTTVTQKKTEIKHWA